MQLITFTSAQPNTVQLQSIGHVQGTPVSELKEGDTIVWNFGSTSKVVGFGKRSASFVEVVCEYENASGKLETGTRKMKLSRIVGRPANELK